LVLAIFSPGAGFGPILIGLLSGVAFGVVFAAAGYAATRGQRDFISTSQLDAQRYDVLSRPRNAERGRELLAELAAKQFGSARDPQRFRPVLDSETDRSAPCTNSDRSANAALASTDTTVHALTGARPHAHPDRASAGTRSRQAPGVVAFTRGIRTSRARRQPLRRAHRRPASPAFRFAVGAASGALRIACRAPGRALRSGSRRSTPQPPALPAHCRAPH